jgi:dihydrofolate synthase/folylpolyglutamate synthase
MLNKMNYQKLRMFNQLPMYQLQGASAYKKDLTNTLNSHLSNPHKSKMRSCCWYKWQGLYLHMLASILQEAGYKVGLYTSPQKISGSALK